MQRYKLFYNQTVLLVTRFEHFNQLPDKKTDCFIFDPSLNVKQLLTNFLSNNISICIFCHTQEDENNIMESIKSFFLFQRAAGGLVVKNGAVLGIYRLERWDFPKGHVEMGETDEEAAMREVTEETGIGALSISKDLGYTYHIFPAPDNQFVLKETHWFEMYTASNKTPFPQKEENITHALWVQLKGFHYIVKNIYPSLKDLIEKCRTKKIIEAPFEIIALDKDQQNFQPVIEAYIGEHPLRLIVDTGASHSCLSEKMIKQFVGKTKIETNIVVGIGRGKLKNNKLIHVPDFRIAELEISNYAFLTLKLTYINRMLSLLGIKPIDGLLGSDILYQYKAIIDYNALKIFFQIENENKKERNNS
ncbi:MAG: NUDIX domain-containing protein [Bacteroidales bacterium]|nr:NUDIX domain-containing protein [Bacteroidales bacterium]